MAAVLARPVLINYWTNLRSSAPSPCDWSLVGLLRRLFRLFGLLHVAHPIAIGISPVAHGAIDRWLRRQIPTVVVTAIAWTGVAPIRSSKVGRWAAMAPVTNQLAAKT